MRAPTPLPPLYEWHRRAIAGERPPIHSEPQLGWFKRRLVKGGPWVPARIFLHQEIDEETGELVAPEELRCEVNGKERDPVEEWTWLAANPIGEAEYLFLVADAAWLRDHKPTAPEANPSVPISSRDIPPLF
jgi:hypothetical protein